MSPKFYIFALSLLCSTKFFGQTIAQNSNNTSSLILGINPDKKEFLEKKNNSKFKDEDFEFGLPATVAINVSTKDKKIAIENLHQFQLKETSDFLIVGLNGSGKINNSIASVFENSNVVGGVTGSLLIGLKKFRIKNEDEIYNHFVSKINKMDKDELKEEIGNIGKIEGHWFFISPSIEGRKFTRFVVDNTFENQKDKITETLWSINFGYNYWTPNLFGFNTTLGISYSPKFSDNFSELTELSLVEQRSDTDGTSQRVTSSKTTVYEGDYITTKKQDLNLEAFFAHNKFPSIGLYLGLLNTYQNELENLTTFSTGLYFSKPKQPTNPSVGIIVNFNDVNNNFNLESENRFSINFVTRLNLTRGFR